MLFIEMLWLRLQGDPLYQPFVMQGYSGSKLALLVPPAYSIAYLYVLRITGPLKWSESSSMLPHGNMKLCSETSQRFDLTQIESLIWLPRSMCSANNRDKWPVAASLLRLCACVSFCSHIPLPFFFHSLLVLDVLSILTPFSNGARVHAFFRINQISKNLVQLGIMGRWLLCTSTIWAWGG